MLRVLGAFLLILMLPAAALASDEETVDTMLKEARRSDSRDVAFMLCRRISHDFPEVPRSMEARFSEGEYHFEGGSFSQAHREFSTVTERSENQLLLLLASCYLREIALKRNKPGEAEFYAQKMKGFFAKKPYKEFLIQKNGQDRWTSPLGQTYVFEESVDSLRIRGGDAHFEITLP